jgi:hypothetical protein
MDNGTDGIDPDDSEQPRDQQNHGDGVQHFDLSLSGVKSSRRKQGEAVRYAYRHSMMQPVTSVCAFENTRIPPLRVAARTRVRLSPWLT